MGPASLKPQELRTATYTVGWKAVRWGAGGPVSKVLPLQGGGSLLVKLHEACLKCQWSGASLVVQWLRFHSPNAGGPGLDPWARN